MFSIRFSTGILRGREFLFQRKKGDFVFQKGKVGVKNPDEAPNLSADASVWLPDWQLIISI